MSLPKFKYLAPKGLQEACALLVEHGEKVRLCAGGTDLLIRLTHRAMTPDFVIGLKNVPGLDHLRCDARRGLVIGAMARLSAVAEHPEIRRLYPALSYSAGVTATVQIRNMGTIVGNICNAAPSADNAAPLLVYGAEVVIARPGGERRLPLDEFFRGPGLTALEMGEIVREIRVPPPAARSGSDYQKLSARGRVDIAAVGVSVWLRLGEDGTCQDVRIALGAVAPTPLRARRTEDLLLDSEITPELTALAGSQAAAEASPITDVRATAAYRRKIVEILTARALGRSVEAARRCDL